MVISEYLSLMHDAVEGRLSLPAFSKAYMEKFQAETNVLPNAVYEVLNDIFLDSDEFVPDRALYESLKRVNPDFVIDETEYMTRIRNAIKLLRPQDS
jgi:uncharacterized protein (DUF2267 family)